MKQSANIAAILRYVEKIALTIDGLDLSKLKFYLVDENNTYAEKEIYLAEDNQIILHLERNSIMYIEM